MELFLIYLWLKLDTLIGIFSILTVLSILALVWRFLYYHTEKGGLYPHWKKLSVFILPFFLVSVLTPSAKDTAILVGASYAMDLAKSPEGIKVQSLIRKKANEFLDAQLAKDVQK